MARLDGVSNHKTEFINNIYVKFHEINPPLARSFIPTPKKLANKNAIINAQNNYNKFFLYSTGTSIYYDEIDKKHPSRVFTKLLKRCARLNIDNKSFPPTIRDTQQFEKIILMFLLQFSNIVVFIK